MQAVVLPYLIWLRLTLVNAALGTDSQAFSAAYAFIRYSVALKSCAVISDSVGLTEYGIYAKIKIFYGSVLYLKAYADIPLVTRIKILKKGIFGKYGVDAFFLPLLRNGICHCGKTYHLVIFRADKYLNTSVGILIFNSYQ